MQVRLVWTVDFYAMHFTCNIKILQTVNERICYLRLKTKRFSCSLVNVHAPTNEKLEEIKEDFCNLLEHSINQIVNLDIKIILGNFNAKVGKENIYKPTIDKQKFT